MTRFLWILVLLALFVFAAPVLAQGDEMGAPFALPTNLLLLGLVVNRIVEAIKQGLPPEETSRPTTFDRWRTPFILALSFTLASLAMLAVFPNDNQFPSAATSTAGLIFTGILVGGIANGWDLAGTFGRAVLSRIEAKVA